VCRMLRVSMLAALGGALCHGAAALAVVKRCAGGGVCLRGRRGAVKGGAVAPMGGGWSEQRGEGFDGGGVASDER